MSDVVKKTTTKPRTPIIKDVVKKTNVQELTQRPRVLTPPKVPNPKGINGYTKFNPLKPITTAWSIFLENNPTAPVEMVLAMVEQAKQGNVAAFKVLGEIYKELGSNAPGLNLNIDKVEGITIRLVDGRSDNESKP